MTVKSSAFSTELKSELCRITAAQTGMTSSEEPPFEDCCAVTFLRAVLIFAGKDTERGYVIRSENPALLEICAYLLIKYYNITLSVVQSGVSGYKLILPHGDKTSALTGSLYIEDGGVITLRDFLCENCFKAFMRAAFLSCGTMLDPEKGYHLELACRDSARLAALENRLAQYSVPVKSSQRKNIFILYMKGSEQIEDFVTMIGGARFALRLMEIKIERENRNSQTRHNNSVVANMDRACIYAVAAVQAIQALRAAGKFELLSESLRETALLREANPSASLSELCRLSDGKLTKSGLNHRLKKIMLLSSELDSTKETAMKENNNE